VEYPITKARRAALAASGQVDDACRNHLLGRTVVLQVHHLADIVEGYRHRLDVVWLEHAVTIKVTTQKWNDRSHSDLLSR
jgi:hypothetical protein